MHGCYGKVHLPLRESKHEVSRKPFAVAMKFFTIQAASELSYAQPVQDIAFIFSLMQGQRAEASQTSRPRLPR